ncbi:MAG: polysaccharide biosynthesis protein [Geobacteraceae bacterium GWC2_58_44]|nr:MAG: polysaccharide biosynthesis protein [Geobacteraceae bacterium GWC2_58_44]HBG05176.1 polysaccharide biosynthesis protein [Geobacter sp.]
MQRRFWSLVVAVSFFSIVQSASGAATDKVSGTAPAAQSSYGYAPANSGYAPASTGYATSPSGYSAAGSGSGAAAAGSAAAGSGYPAPQAYPAGAPAAASPDAALRYAPQAAPVNSGFPLQQPAGRNLELPPGQPALPFGLPTPGNRAQEAPLQPFPAGSGEALREPSAIEKSLSEEPLGFDNPQSQKFSLNDLAQFGYSFFRPDSNGFAAQSDAPVGPDYRLGAGDKLILTLWGSLEGSYELEVNRSGEVVLPKVGSLKVAGVSYGELPGLIRGHLGRVLKNFQLSVNMSKLHLIKVYVVGEVKAPGDYNIMSLSTLLNALSAAGGPTKNGSLRDIQIKRDGKLLYGVDLYDFFLKGDKSRDIRLQAGDTVFVPVIGPVAGIAGNVRRPGIYELKGDKSLRELLALAGGINPSGYLQRIQILRVQSHDKKIVSDLSLDPKGAGKPLDELTGSLAVQDMDMVKIFPIDQTLRSYVRLTGYLLRPGDYALPGGARVSQVLLADNLLPEYFQDAAEVTRLCPPDYHPEKLYFHVGKALKGDPEHDLKLQEFDVLRVFSRWEMQEVPKVRINGEVQKPGEYRLFQNMTLRDLVMQAGNAKLTAYLKSAEISRIRTTGEKVISYPINVNLEQALKGDPSQNVVLEPFDEVSVRRIPNWSEETDRYITLKGEFQFPGTYPIYKGEKLSTLIERAGGFTDKAYLKAAKFTRQLVREEQQLRMDELLARTEQDIARKQGELASVATSAEELAATKASLDGLLRTVEKLKTSKAEGRMVLRLSELSQFKGSPYDVELMGGDTLNVPKTPNSVMVMGQVYNPTTFVQLPGEDVSFYLKKAGGPTREAERGEMYIVRADGTLESRQSHGGFLFFNSFASIELDSGDALVVPQRLERTAWMREIKDIATILGQIALTAGVLVAAGL